MSNILDFLSQIDVEDVRDYISAVENMISWIDGELELGCEDEELVDRLELDKANLQSLICLLSDLIDGLEDL